MTRLYQDPFDLFKFIETDYNTIYCHGGDGTLLRGISLFRDMGLPFFGIAAGTANFLMNQSATIAPQSTTKTLGLLSVTVTTSTSTATVQAFNDIVLGSFNGWCHFNCNHHSDLLGKFSGSALIISTAQGSTGANKNNGGVVLPLSSSNWAVSGVTCNREINYVIECEPITIDITSRAPIHLNADGTSHVFTDVQSISIQTGSTVDVIFNDYHTFTKKRRQ